MCRTSKDGKQTALLVYNFNSTARNVTVDLCGTGIDTHQTPKDLYKGGSANAINGNTYTVSLPAYGFKILDSPCTTAASPARPRAVPSSWSRPCCRRRH